MKVTVIGVGYVGLITGVCLAELGHDVTCIDVVEEKINSLSRGKPTIHEDGLEDLLKKVIKSKKIKFSRGHDSIADSDVVMMALPTPPGADGSADLHFVTEAVDEISDQLKPGTVLVTKSTVPVGTAKKLEAILESNNVDNVDVVSNPEFLKEGVAIKDFMNPDRIVVGADSHNGFAKMRDLYKKFIDQKVNYVEMDRESAELTKYAANTFLATKVSFMNEIANIAERVGANIHSVKEAMGYDERIGNKFLNSGIGFGGSCFPKDVLALKSAANQAGYDFKIADSVLDINKIQKTILLDKILNEFDSLDGKTITIWGLAFKPDTDDVREAPALEMIDQLLSDHNVQIKAHDPKAIETSKYALGDRSDQVDFYEDHIEALSDSDMLIISTEWPEYRQASPSDINTNLTGKHVFDGRNIYSANDMREEGLRYFGVGV